MRDLSQTGPSQPEQTQSGRPPSILWSYSEPTRETQRRAQCHKRIYLRETFDGGRVTDAYHCLRQRRAQDRASDFERLLQMETGNIVPQGSPEREASQRIEKYLEK